MSLRLSRSFPDSNDTFHADSLPSACKLIQDLQSSPGPTSIFRTFLIGGGQLYREALEKPKMEGVYELEQILLTRIIDEGPVKFECDTFLPDFIPSSELRQSTVAEVNTHPGWKICAPEELHRWLSPHSIHDAVSGSADGYELTPLKFSVTSPMKDGPTQFVFQLWKPSGLKL